MTGTPGGVPDLVAPMSVSAGSGQPPTGPDWVVELAWTGHRCVAYVEPGRRTRLLSARGVSMSAAYPELGPHLERRSPRGGMVLDGTLVARGEEHAPRARLLHRRSARVQPTAQHIRAVPVDYQVADLLWLDGHSTVDLPYRDRRTLLEGLGFASAPVWTTSPMPVSELAGLLTIADAKGVDALHARHVGARYHPGGRSPLWVKVPVPRVRQVVVGGWTPTGPAHPDTIASLLLGVPVPGGLRYVGRVGVPGDQRRRLASLRTLGTGRSPFTDPVPPDAARHAVWVAPRLVGSVEFTGFVTAGRLRLPRWLGIVELAGRDLGGDAGAVDGPAAGVKLWARPSDPPPAAAPSAAAGTAAAPSAAGASVSVPADAVSADASSSAAALAAAGAADRPGRVADSAPPPHEPMAAPGPVPPVPARRLEQHFVYNSLNTIAALIRTDPARARELLFGFADLSRAADQPGDSTTTLGAELDAVRAYLRLEQARFGARLRVELHVDPALRGFPLPPLRVLDAVRAAVQQEIEPLAEGGLLAVVATPAGQGCRVEIRAGSAAPVVVTLDPAAVLS